MLWDLDARRPRGRHEIVGERQQVMLLGLVQAQGARDGPQHVVRRHRAAGLFQAAAVALSARSADALESVVAQLDAAGGRAVAVVADLSDPAQVRQAVDEAAGRLDGLDGASNNAGVFERTTDLVERTEEEFAEQVAVNLTGQWAAIAAEVRVMRSGGGAIVSTSSVAGLRQYPLTPVYSAVKRAVNSLTESAAVSYGPDGIRVNVIAAGLTLTEMVLDGWESQQPGIVEALSAAIPLRRAANPGEIAAAAAWLLSDEASFVSGAVLAVTGGAHAWRHCPGRSQPAQANRSTEPPSGSRTVA